MEAATEVNDARLEVGGNNPPADKTELERAAELMATASDWLASRPEIVDTAEADAAQGFVDKLRASKRGLAAAREGELAPHEAAGAAVKARYRGPLETLEATLKALLEKSGAWILKERNRVAAEKAAQEAEAKRLRDEADRLERERLERERLERERIEAARLDAEPKLEAQAEALANAEAADAAVIAADTAARIAEKAATKKVAPVAIKAAGAARAMTMRAYWSAEVTDEGEALRSYASHPTVRAECLKVALRLANELARQEKRESAAPPGFRFLKEERAS